MIDTQALRAEVIRTFPLVPKPAQAILCVHESGCLHCHYLRRDLGPFDQPELPEEGLREVIREMFCLSSQGLQWVLPSYLLACLEDPSGMLGDATEFLIYNLAPSPESEAEARDQFSGLNTVQLECLTHFLQWCAEHEHWSSYCSAEITRGLAFFSTV